MAEQRPHDFLGSGGDLEKQPSHVSQFVDDNDFDDDDYVDATYDRESIRGGSTTLKAPARAAAAAAVPGHDGGDDDDFDPVHFTKEKSRTSTDLKRLYAVRSRLSTRGLPEPPPPPDGGFEAWTQVACGWLAVCVTWGYLNSFGSFQTYYEEVMPDIAPSTISWIGSLQIWLTMIVGLISGRLLDAGYFVPTFLVGATLEVTGVFLMSLSTQYWQLMLTQGVLTGLGGGIFFTPSLALVTTYFDKRRGLAMGIVTTGNSVGGIIYPLVVRQLMPVLGFAWTARVIGFFNLGALSVCAVFMRPRLPPRASGAFIDWSAFKEPVYNLYVAGWFLLMWTNYFTFYYIASYATEILGLNYSMASIMIIIVNGVGVPFRVLIPMASDRFGPLNVLIPIVFAWSIVAFFWLAVTNTGGYYVWTIFYGALSAAFQCLTPTTVASITPRLDKVGTRMGMAFGIISFASMTGPPVGGALLTVSNGQFTAAQIWAALAMLVGAVCCLGARWAKAGGILNKYRC